MGPQDLLTMLSGLSPASFPETALRAFHYQYRHNPVYREFVDLLHISPQSVKDPAAIPHLPVSLFKTREIRSMECDPRIIFTSSGTGGVQSRHFVCHPEVYEWSFLNAFRRFYGEPEEWILFALLPSYLEREGSSLIYMVDRLTRLSSHKLSGFYLYDHDRLLRSVSEARNEGRKIMLLGVTFALLDLAERHSPDLSGITIMETGGMKGRREELTRTELHRFLTEKFNVPRIHSEYGMTELLGQAYSQGEGIFHCPPWISVSVRDISAPLFKAPGSRGGLNITDLSNFYSCSFLATDDVGELNKTGGFLVAGRTDHSDIRGCNLLVQ